MSELPRAALLMVACLVAVPAVAQVHYHDNGMPWSTKTRRGPDAVAGGWYYNLGVTGIRAVLVKERPTELLVKYVFEGAPAAGKIERDDRIVGAGGKKFTTPHRNGYDVGVFGGHGPMMDFGLALDASQGPELGGKLTVDVVRGDETLTVTLDVGTTYGSYGKTFPSDCAKSEKIRAELCEFIASKQRENGSWGTPHANTFAALALLAAGDDKYLPVVEKNVRYHARSTKPGDDSWLINWRYMAAGIVMSEYYLKSRAKWVLPELQEVYDFLMTTQYTDLSQVAETAKERKLPRRDEQALGGWGHNPGFEGYGPIAKITAQGALTFALMHRCGIAIDRARHDMAYEFVARGTGRNGYVWYADEPSRHDRWADMGRTGTAAVANFVSPYEDEKYRARALDHARVIGKHPETMPDTHGSPIMGMGFTAMGAHADPASFRRMLDANRWWFTLAQCHDGTFYYQPNRDNNSSDFTSGSSRLSASAVVALIFSLDKKNLCVTGAGKRRL